MAQKRQQVAAIEADMSAPGFWDRQEAAQQTVMKLKALTGVVKPLESALASADDLATMMEMADEDESLVPEVVDELDRLEKAVDALELKSLLGGENDNAGAILSINARDGGTDANDWAEMLLRMYSLWAQRNEYQIELLDRQDNEAAGINSASFVIRGPYAYGYLKGETGMHRLVRISPFNAEGKRQTSFASVDVTPELPDDVDITIDEEDVRIDTFRASGAGGQHVNKTSSAVRLTHIPTNIVVSCQNERSQHKNRATAWKMLRAQMARREEEKREAAQEQKYRQQAKVGFGSQIRSYFQHPDQRIKDSRTGYGENNFQYVLDGHIDGFLESCLRWRVQAHDGSPPSD